MRNNEIFYAIEKFEQAVNKLKEASLKAKNELEIDGTIQRFEFTFELLWKTLKIILENEGYKCSSPKESLKLAFKTGIISDEEIFLNMLEDRNITSHIYNKEQAEKIFFKIKNEYFPEIEKILTILKSTGGKHL